MKDMHNSIHPVPLIAPVAARIDDTAIVSAIIDRKGYQSLELLLLTGTNTDADVTVSVLVEDGNAADLADNAAVPDSELVGTEALAAFNYGDDVECRKVGYVGTKRYVRMTVIPSGNNAGNIFLAGIAILGDPEIWPTANPPQ